MGGVIGAPISDLIKFQVAKIRVKILHQPKAFIWVFIILAIPKLWFLQYYFFMYNFFNGLSCLDRNYFSGFLWVPSLSNCTIMLETYVL